MKKKDYVHVNIAYKQKADKIKLVNLEKSTDETPGKLTNWWEVLWAWQMKHSELIESDSPHQYNVYIMSRFSQLAWESQLTFEQIQKLKISLKLTSNKQDFLLKILMRQEECLVWSMLNLSWIHSEVVPLQKICTISHEVWQAPSFLISKDLLRIVMKML